MFERIDELLADPLTASTGGTDPPRSRSQTELSSIQLAEILRDARVPFRVEQRIARLPDDRLPGPSEFFPVMCRDLSTNGVAFLLADQPDFTSVVFAMGDPPTVKYIKARVVHRTNVLVDASGLVRRTGGETPADRDFDGPARPMVLVGCEFLHDIPAEQFAPDPPNATG
mgnify:CR=1 FL=1